MDRLSIFTLCSYLLSAGITIRSILQCAWQAPNAPTGILVVIVVTNSNCNNNKIRSSKLSVRCLMCRLHNKYFYEWYDE